MTDVTLTNNHLFNSDGIVITRELANIRGTSFPINGIGSVRVAAPNRTGAIVAGLVLCFVDYQTSQNGASNAAVWFVLGVVAFIAGYQMKYTLFIHTASSDRPALKGGKEFLLSVKQAIEAAVTLRG